MDKKSGYTILLTIMFFFIGYGAGHSEVIRLTNEHYLAPKSTVFVMYTEKCQCGYDNAEVEFSIVSNKGYFDCPKCRSNYEFSLDETGNIKVN